MLSFTKDHTRIFTEDLCKYQTIVSKSDQIRCKHPWTLLNCSTLYWYRYGQVVQEVQEFQIDTSRSMKGTGDKSVIAHLLYSVHFRLLAKE